jgi:polyhydroxyalkanoate synthesis regulator phasin
MSKQRQKFLHGNLPATSEKKRPAVDKYPRRLFPVQHEIQELERELNAFNERIADLENEGDRGHDRIHARLCD